MTYQVLFTNDDQVLVGHSSIYPKQRLLNTRVVQSVSPEIDTFTFGALSDNHIISFIKNKQTRVEVVDMSTEYVEFDGRIADSSKSIQDDVLTYSYICESMIGVLRDTRQKPHQYKGSPSGLLKIMIDRHNELTADEPWKQFAVGRCEIDTYKAYGKEVEEVNLSLSVGDDATIKPTTKYIWNDNGTRLNIASSVLGVKHTVETVGASGTFEGKYRLRHPIPAWGISGWIQAEDIVEVYTTSGAGSGTSTQSTSADRYPEGTAVRLKPSATTYYWSADGTRPTVIGQTYKGWNYTIREYSSKYERYAIYHNGVLTAWANTHDLDFGSETLPKDDGERPPYTDHERIIEVELSYEDETYDAIVSLLLEPYEAEMTYEIIEGVRTLNILNRVENETEIVIRPHLNLIALDLEDNFQDIYSAVIPIGKLFKEETEPAAQSVQILSQTIGTEKLESFPVQGLPSSDTQAGDNNG